MTFVATIGTPQTPAVGHLRFNETTSQMEMYTGNGWVPIATGMGMNEKKLICEDLNFGIPLYKVDAEGYDFDELNEWCNQTFGPPRIGPGQPECKWFISGGEFYFHEKKNRDWFVLKWTSDGR